MVAIIYRTNKIDTSAALIRADEAAGNPKTNEFDKIFRKAEKRQRTRLAIMADEDPVFKSGEDHPSFHTRPLECTQMDPIIHGDWFVFESMVMQFNAIDLLGFLQFYEHGQRVRWSLSPESKEGVLWDIIVQVNRDLVARINQYLPWMNLVDIVQTILGVKVKCILEPSCNQVMNSAWDERILVIPDVGPRAFTPKEGLILQLLCEDANISCLRLSEENMVQYFYQCY